MQEAQNSVHPLILSSVFHYEFVFIHPFSEAMAEWQGYGILLSFPGGSRYLNIFQLRVRLKSFKTNIMMRSPDVMEYDIPYPGGESAGDVVRRVIPVFRQIRESGYEKVAVVTHGGVIRSMTAHFLGMDMAKWRTLGTSLENCSITELNYSPRLRRYTLERFNDYAHLQPYPQLLRSAWADAEN